MVDWRFHVQISEPGQLESHFPECQSLIVRSPYELGQPIDFFSAFRRLCLEEKFDVVHVHADLMSAPYLAAARTAGVRRLIVHVHNADEHLPTSNPVKKRLLREPMRRFCLSMADRIVGISNHTLDTFLAGRPRRPERDSVQLYGVDPKSFENATGDRARFRRGCGLPDDALILLFAGRIVPEKNPLFVVDVLAGLRRLQCNAFAVFAGSGSEVDNIIARAKALGVDGVVRMLGWRSDLAEVMSCSDWFILPHPEHPPEGFGLAVVEAQLAGLRMLLSPGVQDDPLLPTASFRRLSLCDKPYEWAEAAMELFHENSPSRSDAIAALNESPMNMDNALNGLLSLYA